MPKFKSDFKKVGEVNLPEFTGTRVMMMPIVIGDLNSVPEDLHHYNDFLAELFDIPEANQHKGKVGYITIDEKSVEPGNSHRREGLHVDGVFQGSCGGWGGGMGGGMGVSREWNVNRFISCRLPSMASRF